MATFLKSFEGRRVLVTGHTGFKGSWLSEWLIGLGSDVWGFSLPPPTRPALFKQIGLASRMNHIIGDIRHPAAIRKAVAAARPDYVFHLAAQPIVRTAHSEPTQTWATNVMGTVHLLDALRKLNRPCAAVIVTTDKVYGTGSGARTENEASGATDIYGASKAAAEVAVHAWRHSFYGSSVKGQVRLPFVAVATARSGNVIGGGDWAKDRILPDCIRALARARPILVRNPSAVRPWQHVLDPLCGYLSLAAELRKAVVLRDDARIAELWCSATGREPGFRVSPATLRSRVPCSGSTPERRQGSWDGSLDGISKGAWRTPWPGTRRPPHPRRPSPPRSAKSRASRSNDNEPLLQARRAQVAD
jgi:CDP-glucose 4,6-dehydratase